MHVAPLRPLDLNTSQALLRALKTLKAVNKDTLAAIPLIGEFTEGTPRHIRRRHYDDLPAHVKGSIVFQEDNTPPHKDRGYHLPLDKGHDLFPVKFISINDVDQWCTLINQPGEPEHHWYMTDRCLVPRLEHGTGYWYITDPQHPDYVDLGADSPGEDEEVITGGTHHIVTLQGGQPLSQTEPILPAIEAAAAEGASIPVDIPPIASTLHAPTMSGAQIGTTTTGNAPQPINVINTGNALKGHPPAPFDGERKKSKGFLLTFKLYQGLNR